MKYTIIKKLGNGMYGTVFLIKYKNNNHALKIEHVLESDLDKNMESKVLREIIFCHKFASKYPNQFIQLLDYDFINNCEHIQKYTFDMTVWPNEIQKEYKNLAQSKYCSRKIFTLVDSTLDKIIKKLSINQIYSMIIQVTYIVYLLHSNNYVHGDLYINNIGYIKTTKKYISILNYKIKTFGYIYKVIDYGRVLHKSDSNNKKPYNFCYQHYNYCKYELTNIIYTFIKPSSIYKNIKLDYAKINRDMKKSSHFNFIEKLSENDNIQKFLFKIIYQEEYQKIVLGDKFEKVVNLKLRIPFEDILFFVIMATKQNYIKLIEYFNDKL